MHLQKGGKGPDPREKAVKAEGVLVAVTSEAKVCMHPTPLMPLCASLPGFLPLLLTQMSSHIDPCFQVVGEKPDDEVHKELGPGGELLADVAKEVGARKSES